MNVHDIPAPNVRRKADAWMPFFVGDYLSATSRLTTEQHGAYLLIILDYWKNGPPPDDDAVLAQIARLAPAAWKRARAALCGFFDIVDGQWIQKRVEHERERAANITGERSKAGKAGAAKRWSKRSKPIANAMQLPLANAQQNDAPSPSPSSTNVELNASPDGEVSSGTTPLTPKEVVDAWQERMVPQGFPAIRKMTATRERQLKARLKDSTLQDWQDAMDALERSAFCRGENDRGWRADFDFLLQPKSFTKLLEGAYDH